MALSITLYQFSKKSNSTARPTGTGVVLNNCYWLDDTDVIRPAVRLVYDPQFDPTIYNYAYMSGRYYFIDSWTYTNRGWVAYMNEDFLATFKNTVGDLTSYVYRSSYENDGDVVDTLYPSKASCVVDEIPLTNPWTYSVSGGCFVIGVISKDAIYGSVRYCAMDYTNFTTLCNALLADSLLIDGNFDIDDASLALQKSIVDPLQYIVSAVFIPIPLSSIVGTTRSKLAVWDWEITVANTEITLNPYSDNSANVTLPKHPATAARGNYVNGSPLTRAELNFPPFGTIELDTSITATHPYIYLRYSVDYISGEGTLRVFAREAAASAEQVLIGETSARVGVPIQLSQVDRNHLGAIGGVLGGIISAFTGNWMGLAEGIGSGISSMVAHPKTSGSNGTFYQLQYTPAMYMTFMDLVPADNDHHGRPLMGNRKFSNIPGFIQADSSGVTIGGALTAELDAIKSHIEEGFYYE